MSFEEIGRKGKRREERKNVGEEVVRVKWE